MAGLLLAGLLLASLSMAGVAVAGSTRLTVLVVATLEFSDSEVKTSSVLSCSCLDSRWSCRPWLSSLSLLAPGRHRAESEEQLENWNTAELSELSGCVLCTVYCIVSEVITLNSLQCHCISVSCCSGIHVKPLSLQCIFS